MITEKEIEDLKAFHTKLDLNINFYVCGSYLIENIEFHDIDLILFYKKGINITELRLTRTLFKKYFDTELYDLHFIMEEDNHFKSDKYPYYNLLTGDKFLLDREQLTEKQYNQFRADMKESIKNRKNFFKQIIKSKEENTRTKYLRTLL